MPLPLTALAITTVFASCPQQQRRWCSGIHTWIQPAVSHVQSAHKCGFGVWATGHSMGKHSVPPTCKLSRKGELVPHCYHSSTPWLESPHFLLTLTICVLVLAVCRRWSVSAGETEGPTENHQCGLCLRLPWWHEELRREELFDLQSPTLPYWGGGGGSCMPCTYLTSWPAGQPNPTTKEPVPAEEVAVQKTPKKNKQSPKKDEVAVKTPIKEKKPSPKKTFASIMCVVRSFLSLQLSQSGIAWKELVTLGRHFIATSWRCLVLVGADLCPCDVMGMSIHGPSMHLHRGGAKGFLELESSAEEEVLLINTQRCKQSAILPCHST